MFELPRLNYEGYADLAEREGKEVESVDLGSDDVNVVRIETLSGSKYFVEKSETLSSPNEKFVFAHIGSFDSAVISDGYQEELFASRHLAVGSNFRCFSLNDHLKGFTTSIVTRIVLLARVASVSEKS